LSHKEAHKEYSHKKAHKAQEIKAISFCAFCASLWPDLSVLFCG